MKNKVSSANKPVKTFLILHGWKIAWILTALGIELAFLIYEWNEKSRTGFFGLNLCLLKRLNTRVILLLLSC